MPKRSWRSKAANIEAWCTQHCLIPEELDTEADAIKAAYTTRRRALQPKYWPSSERYPQDFWRVLAIILRDHNYDPWKYIEHCYKYFGRYPEPAQLTSEKVLGAFHFNEDEELSKVRYEISSNAQRLRFEMDTTGLPASDLLANESKGFNAVFVWCVARREGYLGLVAQHTKWVQHVLQSPAQRKAYAEVFPEVFQ